MAWQMRSGGLLPTAASWNSTKLEQGRHPEFGLWLEGWISETDGAVSEDAVRPWPRPDQVARLFGSMATYRRRVLAELAARARAGEPYRAIPIPDAVRADAVRTVLAVFNRPRARTGGLSPALRESGTTDGRPAIARVKGRPVELADPGLRGSLAIVGDDVHQNAELLLRGAWSDLAAPTCSVILIARDLRLVRILSRIVDRSFTELDEIGLADIEAAVRARSPIAVAGSARARIAALRAARKFVRSAPASAPTLSVHVEDAGDVVATSILLAAELERSRPRRRDALTVAWTPRPRMIDFGLIRACGSLLACEVHDTLVRRFLDRETLSRFDRPERLARARALINPTLRHFARVLIDETAARPPFFR